MEGEAASRPDRRTRLLFVGAFNDANVSIAGGNLTICRTLLATRFVTELDIAKVDSTQASQPPPGLAKLVAASLRRLSAFRRLLRDPEPDAVLIFASAGLSLLEKGLMAHMAAGRGKPIILSIRSGRFLDACRRYRAYRSLAGRLVRPADILLCQGTNWVAFYRDAFGIDPARCAVIPNWTADAAHLGLPVPDPAQVPAILFLGWVERDKGVFDLLEAASRLRARGAPEFRVIIAGGGGGLERARALAASLGLADRVEFTGWISPARCVGLFADSAIFALPSLVESLPNSMIEAMAAGRPVVVTPVGGIPGVIRDGENGLIIPPRDPERLAEALGRLLSDPGLRDRLGRAARADARVGFTPEAAAERLLDLIARLARRERRPAGGITVPLALALLTLAGSAAAAANPNLPLDRPYTLRNPGPQALEAEYARSTRSGAPLSFIYPRPCADLDTVPACGTPAGFVFEDNARDRRIGLSPGAGYEFRSGVETVNALELGAVGSGSSGPLSFYVDARTFTEFHENAAHRSFDHEFVEKQDREASGSVAYSSYSRYRSNLDYDLPWGRLSVARDAAHWGPGQYANLVFNQGALPFNQVTWTSHLGPVSIASLYGRLVIATDSADSFNRTGDSRSLYAHRYEWRALPDLLLGASEQLIFFNEEDPFAFVPVVPLFIAKGARAERSNNGNLSGDVTWRLRWLGAVYAEFLIDDLQSPTSLFDGFWGNKWAFMAGFRMEGAVAFGRAGMVAEYSRVEPWVYTHYIAATAQAANGDLPLGNPRGPNTQWVVLQAYARLAAGGYAALRSELIWKGRNLGSSLADDRSGEPPLRKEFLGDAGGPRLAITPRIAWPWKALDFESSATFGEDPAWMARLAWRY